MERIDYGFLDQLLKIKSYTLFEKQRCALIIAEKLKQMNFKVEEFSHNGVPIILGHLDTGAERNILFYLHYDVKPEGNLKKWNTNPFIPYYDYEKKKIYARGAGDNKGQIFSVLTGIEMAKECKRVVYNVYVLIEGNEENHSVGLKEFCDKRMQNVKFEAVLINDSHWQGASPVIYCGTRGQMEISLTYNVLGMTEDLHAGNYGGMQIGAAHKLLDITSEVMLEMKKVLSTYYVPCGDFGNAVSLIYFSAGDANRSLIPKSALSKIDVRFIDNVIVKQTKEILEEKKSYRGFDYSIEQLEEGYYNKPDATFVNKLYSAAYNTTGIIPQVKDYCGAYLPMKKMENIDGTKYVLPFAQADENNHAPNENISFRNIIYGIEMVKAILTNNEV